MTELTEDGVRESDGSEEGGDDEVGGWRWGETRNEDASKLLPCARPARKVRTLSSPFSAALLR